MPVAWVRCIAPSIRDFIARLPSRCCRRLCPDDPDRVARLAREARLLAALNHPHIATIHGLEIAAGPAAIVMELIEGPTLADRLAERTVGARRGARDRAPDRRGARGRARERRHPSRSQAGQHQVHRCGDGEGARLWPREGDGSGLARGQYGASRCRAPRAAKASWRERRAI